MEIPTIESIKKLAYEQMEKLNIKIFKNPFDTLASIQWPEGKSNYTQLEVREANFKLNPTFCSGRAAVCLAVLEKYFPEYKAEIGEVLEDGLAKLLLDTMPANPETSYLEEILMYEDPHDIVMIDDEQFDPIIAQHNLGIEHPRVNILPGWEAILVDYYIALYNHTNNLAEKIFYLKKAEKICPKVINIKENSIHLMALLGRDGEDLIEIMKEVLELRSTARLLFTLYHFTHEDQYLRKLTSKYTNNIIPIIRKEISNG